MGSNDVRQPTAQPPPRERSGARPALKLLLVLLGAGAMGLLGLGGAIALWGPRLMRGMQSVQREGATFGSGRSASACLDEALRRADACAAWNVQCRMEHQLFMQGCFQVCTVDEGFCDEVPEPSDLVASLRARGEACAARQRPGDAGCLQLMQALQMQCSAWRDALTPPANQGPPPR